MAVNNQIESKLSTLQLELLKIFAFNPSEEELLEVKDMLARFFAYRFTEKITQATEEQGISETDLDNWLEEDEQ